MHKRKIIRIFFSSLMLAVFFFGDLAFAATDVNYGTTTFFSGKDEKPPVSRPILDHGSGTSGRKRSQDKDADKEEDSDGSLFDQIIGGIGSLFDNSDENSFTDSAEKRSLFDLQSGDDQDGNSDDDSYSSEEYIMGPRGESYENLDEEEAAKYQSRFAQNFNFGDTGKDAAPKKSKLLFTNVEVPIDMTTQYVLIGLSFFIAVGAAVGYYFWKKEAGAENKKYNSDDEI